jgi:hypothetical protein
MIDDASSRIHAQFVLSDSTEENMRLLWKYVERYGRPVSFYTDKASLFQTAPKVPWDSKALPVEERDPLPPTQVGRALRELDIVWIAAHMPMKFFCLCFHMRSLHPPIATGPAIARIVTAPGPRVRHTSGRHRHLNSRSGSGPDHIDDHAGIGEHRDMAAVDGMGARLHALGEALQSRVNRTVVIRHDVRTWF